MRKTGQTNYVKYGELSRIKGVTTIIRADVAGKQDKLTEPQLAAVNSGITAAKVQAYDIAAGFAHSHDNKTTVLDKLKWCARNNTIYIGDEDHPINFYAYGAITAGGVGSGGGGGQGGISTIYLGSTRYDAEEGSTAIYLPAYPTQVTWANISGKPSWIGSSKPSYAFSEITGAASAAQIPSLDASKITTGTFDAARIPGLDWSKITSGKPTTIAGYGITDGVTTATLAAWSGSVNITKVGTIATGVWHGTAIGDSYIASATNWNDAYDKRHVHSNKTVLDSITAQDITDLRNLASWFGWDSEYEAVYVKKSATDEARNFYTYGAITAGGVGSGGGGSTGALYTCVDVTAYNSSKVGRDSTHPAQSGDLLAFDGNKWHAVVAPATGVTTFGGQAGAITVRGGQTANGSVNLAMSGTQLQASIVGLGSLAYKSSLAASDIPSLDASKITSGTFDAARIPTLAISKISGLQTELNAKESTISDLATIRSNAANGQIAHGWGNHAGLYLPLTGGAITGTVHMDGNSTAAPLVRNYTSTVSAGWSRHVAQIQVDGTAKFIIGAYGAYVAGASDNGISYAYAGLNGYNGNNLRFYSDRLTFGSNLIYHAGNLTKATLGLGNVDNTADANKSVAYAANAGRLGGIAAANYYHSGNSNKSDVAWACSTLTASGNITGALLKSTTNGNTVTIGSQNASFCHIYNSADVPFIFNKNIQTYGGLLPYGSGTHDLGNSSHRWGDAYVNGINASGNATIAGNLSMGDTLNMNGNEVLFASSSTLYVNSGLQTRIVDFFGTDIRIRNTGNVGIGTTSPSQKLHVVGNIIATGAITAGAASDARLKDNIRNLANAVTVLKSLRPVSFDWNATATSNYSALKGHDVGLVAQEVEPYIPSAIGTIFGDYKRLDYTKVTPYLIAGWQDHESRIAALEKENTELKRRLNMS